MLEIAKQVERIINKMVSITAPAYMEQHPLSIRKDREEVCAWSMFPTAHSITIEPGVRGCFCVVVQFSDSQIYTYGINAAGQHINYYDAINGFEDNIIED